ncbi:MAG: hypothetical protein [Caudoviricetes sp.]|nr:MAG: hypothetical protein [Caudoviricetes sp.]
MKHYDPNTFTYGFEIEWGDVDRNMPIPEDLGSWEYCETDIINMREPYRGLGSDPKGINPPVGGEINMKPTKTWQHQVDNIMKVKELFDAHGTPPTAGCVNHGHLHIHVPGLTEDIDALKRMMRYIRENQHITMERVYQFRVYPNMEMTKTAKTYLKHDGGRIAPDWLLVNLATVPVDFEDWLRVHCCGKDAKTLSRPFRYGVHTYALKNSKTIEFRCFRSSLDRREIEDSFRFATAFIDAALNNGPDVQEILFNNDFKFPPFTYDHEMYMGWEKTKYQRTDRNLDNETAEKLGLNVLGKQRKFLEAI